MHRSMLTKYQDSYGEAMKGFGLERGIVGSIAKHVSNSTYYKQKMESIQENIDILIRETEEKQEKLTKLKKKRKQPKRAKTSSLVSSIRATWQRQEQPLPSRPHRLNHCKNVSEYWSRRKSNWQRMERKPVSIWSKPWKRQSENRMLIRERTRIWKRKTGNLTARQIPIVIGFLLGLRSLTFTFPQDMYHHQACTFGHR